MATHKRELMVGLFVTFGSLVAIAGVVWLGASETLKGGRMYVSYFSQSVGSLDTDSTVSYMGLDIGTVHSVSVSPDPRLIAVVMKIRHPELVTDTTVSQIQSIGFTGITIVALSQKNAKAQAQAYAPELDFKPPYPVIPAQQSGTGSLMADAQRVIDQIESLDLQGVIDDVHATVRGARDLVTGPEIQHTVDNLAAASGNLHEITTRLDRMVGSDSFQQIPGDAQQILTEAQRAITDARRQIQALQLGQTSQEVNHMVGSMSDRSQVITAQVEGLVQDLRQASDNLNRLLERLDQNPSELIFGKPAPRQQ